MEIHEQPLRDVERYIARRGKVGVEDKSQQFESLLRYASAIAPLEKDAQILEVGTGLGWFPILCALRGYQCEALEISPQLVAAAQELAKAHGVDVNIRLANLEDRPLERGKYDYIVASSVFEHVEFWKDGLAHLHEALKPGGILFWESTNKYSPVSGEHWWPLYGWLPNALRFRLRTALQGADIMKLGIDFHQFTYPQVRGEFERLGFRRILDRVEAANPDWVESGFRRWVLTRCKQVPLLRRVVLTFFPLTTFVCQK